MQGDGNSVEVEQAVAKLCLVLHSLVRREKALNEFLGHPYDASLDEITDLKDAILDLCGTPNDNTEGSFRFGLNQELEELVEDLSAKKEYASAYHKIREIITEGAKI